MALRMLSPCPKFRCPAFILGATLSAGCGATAPSPLPPPSSSSAWAPDIGQVTQRIVDELRSLGLDVVMAERTPMAPFSVGAQRIDIPSIEDESIWIRVYATAELAWDEASRIKPDGNLRPPPGEMPHVIVDYIGTMHFHYRDRVIAVYGGCDAEIKRTMETLFGPPLIVAHGLRSCPQ